MRRTRDKAVEGQRTIQSHEVHLFTLLVSIIIYNINENNWFGCQKQNHSATKSLDKSAVI
jgi:hypothetical protein